jgi:hypothetical protein
MKIPHKQWGFQAFLKAQEIKKIEDLLKRHERVKRILKKKGIKL